MKKKKNSYKTTKLVICSFSDINNFYSLNALRVLETIKIYKGKE